MRRPNCEEEYKGVLVIALFVISLIMLIPIAIATNAFTVISIIFGCIGLIVSVWTAIEGMSDDEIEMAWIFEKPEVVEDPQVINEEK